ncbi:MAG: hypothetical protein WBP64_20230 [Nitrososphaeraceae archaeon]
MGNKTSHLYISIHGRINGDHFHWDSELMHEQVIGDPAEIERVFDRELEIEVVVKSLGDSDGLACVLG